MTTRNLQAVFAPASVALIGASNQPGSVGRVLARNLTSAGFRGPVMPVNPHETAIGSTLCHPSVAALPVDPELAVIATPAPSVPGLVAELAARGCRAAVVISAGLAEPALKRRVLEAARPTLMRVIGPNCLGVASPSVGLNATFAHLDPPKGKVALVTQSGAVATAALDWAAGRGFGFSRVASLGEMADVDFGDMLDWLALDAETEAILLYVEAVTDARKFVSACRMASRNKPVVVIKSGRSAAGAKAAMSHTGALAGSDAVYEAAFRRAGALRVDSLRDLFDMVGALTRGVSVKGGRLAIVTNGGGAGVMAVDALTLAGGELAALAPATVEALNRSMPANWSHGNPVDVLGDAGPERYGAAMDAVLADPGADAVLVLNCPTAVADSAEAARATLAVLEKHRAARRPVYTCWLGDGAAAPARRLFTAAGLPTHETPEESVGAFLRAATYSRNQALLMEAPPETAGPVDLAPARTILEKALAEGRSALSEPECKALLEAVGLPVVRSRIAATPEAAAEAAEAIGDPVALKIFSPDISHKSDLGGVILNLPHTAVAAEAAAMAQRIAARAPQARLGGFIVEAMAERPGAHELIAGIGVDPTFGPVVLVGAGGVAVEVLADRSIGLPPLNVALARDMIGRTRVSRLLAGYRDRPAIDMAALEEVLITLSRLAVELPQIAELDINPLLADAQGVLAVDARIRLSPVEGRPRPAIAPYPQDLVRRETDDEGRAFTLRPIMPQDAARLQDLIARSSNEDVRLRFRGGVARLPAAWAARLSQIDYDREMALVADAGEDGVWGVARLHADPEGESAEFALIVRTDRQAHGLGHRLMLDLIAYAGGRGLKALWGGVAAENGRMLQLAEHLGFRRGFSEEAGYLRVELMLGRKSVES